MKSAASKSAPQALKRDIFPRLIGATEVVPFPVRANSGGCHFPTNHDRWG
jgi:hypothetical protein